MENCTYMEMKWKIYAEWLMKTVYLLDIYYMEYVTALHSSPSQYVIASLGDKQRNSQY